MAVPAKLVVAAVTPLVFGLVKLIQHGASKTTSRRLVILGGPQVGKTTLLRLLRDGSVSSDVRPTIQPVSGGAMTIDTGGKPSKFVMRKDLPGSDGLGYPLWRAAFDKADVVLYLFRADFVADRDEAELARIKQHLDYIDSWMKAKKLGKPTVVLIGTRADARPMFRTDRSGFSRFVASAGEVSLGSLKLNNARVLVGGLDMKNAGSLVTELGECLDVS